MRPPAECGQDSDTHLPPSFSFQRKVEMFHEGMQSGMFGDNEDTYVSKTIALVNCCPPFRFLSHDH